MKTPKMNPMHRQILKDILFVLFLLLLIAMVGFFLLAQAIGQVLGSLNF